MESSQAISVQTFAAEASASLKVRVRDGLESRPVYGSLELTAEEARRLCQVSLDIVCITDFSGQILWSNQVECQITGFTREELMQGSLLSLTHPDDLDKVAVGLADVAVGKLHPCTEIRTLCKDGTYKWISWSGVPIPEEQKIYAIGRDITAQRLAESTVRRLAAIVEASSEAIFSIDSSRRISSWNKGAEKLYGYTAEEVLKEPASILFQDDKNIEFAEAAAGNHSEAIEDTHVCKDGHKIDVSISAFPVLDERGGTGYAAIVRDITLQKEAERSIAEFYSITSHELRTPLSSVRGVLSLLENGIVNAASKQGKELIEMARSSCDRLVRLVNDILDLRRIESGKIRLDLERLSTMDLLNFALADISALAKESLVNIEIDLQAKGTIRGDKDRLTQVLTNLLSNAIKYSDAGDTIKVTVDMKTPATVRYSVQDQGPGIDKEQVHKLFKKFGQLDSSDSRPKEGIGLGLFVARSIIEKHNGKIGVSLPETGGSNFWFELALID